MFLYVINFFIILLSITLFLLPFLIWFRIQTKQNIKPKEINLYLERFFSSYQANWLVFAWAASEAVIWFVIPEFLLLLIVFMRINKKRELLIYDVAGTIFGTIVALIIRLPEETINKLPYIQQRMLDQTRTWYEDQGLFALANQPFSGVPYKTFTHLAPEYGFHVILFVLMAVLVRILRYLFAYGLFISLYPKLHKVVRQNYISLALVAILIFSILLMRTYMHYV